jgi:hypothetical protein
MRPGPPDETGFDLVAVGEETDRGRGLGDPAGEAPAERFGQHPRRRDGRGELGEEPFDRVLFGLGVGASVGDLLGPGHEVVVELLEVGDPAVFHLGDERGADVGVESFLLAPALRLVGLGVHQVHAQHRARSGQLMVRIRGAVIDIAPTSAQCRLCRCPRYADHEREALVGQGEQAEQVGIIQLG